MKRGLSPAFVITMACAHSAPTSGNEYKVVNWLRAGAIIAQIDPVAEGYLYKDSKGNLRLPPLRHWTTTSTSMPPDKPMSSRNTPCTISLTPTLPIRGQR